MAGELSYDPTTGQLVYSPATGQLALNCGPCTKCAGDQPDAVVTITPGDCGVDKAFCAAGSGTYEFRCFTSDAEGCKWRWCKTGPAGWWLTIEYKYATGWEGGTNVVCNSSGNLSGTAAWGMGNAGAGQNCTGCTYNVVLGGP